MNDIDTTKILEIFRKYGITSIGPIDYQKFVEELVNLKKDVE